MHNNCLLPPTLIGASNSKSIGWDMNISWALRHKFRMSASGKFIILIFLESRTKFKRFSYDVYRRFITFSESMTYYKPKCTELNCELQEYGAYTQI